MIRSRIVKVLGVFAAMVLLASCGHKDHLSAKQMENILFDLHRAEGIIWERGIERGHDEEVRAYYQVVMDKYGVTQAQFDSSLVWYTDHPERFNKIYPRVIKRLEAEKAKLEP